MLVYRKIAETSTIDDRISKIFRPHEEYNRGCKVFVTIKKATLIGIVSIALVAVILLSSVAVTDSACVYFGKSTRKIPVYSVLTEDKVIALTFDAAWGAEPRPDSFEKIPLATPFCIAMNIVGRDPPATALKLNACSKIRATA